MVFSIMQLMGVTLDPSNFDPDDHLGVTMALASKILDKGGSADWLGLLAKNPALTDVAGEENFLPAGKWCTGRSLDDWAFAYSYWYRNTWKQRLYGKMDDTGYLIFTRKACKLVRDTEGLVWLELDESEWLEIGNHTQQVTWVPLWDFIEPVMANKFEIENLTLENSVTKFMLLAEHATGKFHVMSYFYSRKVDGR
ncbi:hypothetical protein ACQKWADRAFT_324833 [Trichoderma austrokoningii]